MGSVYVANTANTWVDYQVNNKAIQAAKPRPLTGPPAFVNVARAKFPDPGSFGLGDNKFWVSFRDWVPPEPAECNFTITVPPDSSLLDDLLLYVFRGFAFLMSTRGMVLQSAWPNGAPAAPAAGPQPEGGGETAPSPPHSPQEAEMSDQNEEVGAGVGGNGNVVVFNCYNEPVSGLQVNNGVPGSGSIGGWSTGGSGNPPLYTPAQIVVPRSKFPQPGQFSSNAGNQNKLVVPWVSWTGNASIVIPPDSSLLDDFILFVTLNKAVLMSTRGMVVNTFDVTQSPTMTKEGGDGQQDSGSTS